MKEGLLCWFSFPEKKVSFNSATKVHSRRILLFTIVGNTSLRSQVILWSCLHREQNTLLISTPFIHIMFTNILALLEWYRATSFSLYSRWLQWLPSPILSKGDQAENKRRAMKAARHLHCEITLYGFIFFQSPFHLCLFPLQSRNNDWKLGSSLTSVPLHVSDICTLSACTFDRRESEPRVPGLKNQHNTDSSFCGPLSQRAQNKVRKGVSQFAPRA